jgi:hypothetical protein
MTGLELVRICISGKGVPERIRWAADMSVSLPEPLARCLSSMSYDEAETKALARRSLHNIRIIQLVPKPVARTFAYIAFPHSTEESAREALFRLSSCRRRSGVSGRLL